jgi:transposase InsO family protein
MAVANPLWGAPRIHGELLKLGFDISERTTSRLMPRRGKPPSQTWRTFLKNHLGATVAVDFFAVPTLTCRILFVCVILVHDRRRILHVNVTRHPTSVWIRQQLREVFPDDATARFLLHDRDATFDMAFVNTINAFGLTSVRTAPRSPWQNPYVERVIGSIRRECLDHVIIFNERHLRRVLRAYVVYYHRSRTHLALAKDTPEARAVERLAPVGLSRGRKSADSITATNGKRPESVSRGIHTCLGVKVCLRAGPTASPGRVPCSAWPIAVPHRPNSTSFCP